MGCLRVEGFQKILSFLEVCHHFLTPSLVLICNLTDNKLGIAVDFQRFHLHFFGEVKSHYQRFILNFVVGGLELES